MSRPLLAARGLSVSFGGLDAVDGVTFDVADGEFVALIGPSGCGKSTVLRALAGLLPGIARVSGEVAVPQRGGRADVAWMPQRDALLPWRRAWGNALLGARVAGVPDAESRAAELFDRFGLAGFERAWPHELSGGMRQRLALLRTVLAGRRALLLDEPFGALDALTRRSMNDWLAELRLTQSVVLVTHDVDEALHLADRVLVMSSRPGRIVHELRVPRPGDGTTARAEPGHGPRAELLGALTGTPA